jgi:hypothetical protein
VEWVPYDLEPEELFEFLNINNADHITLEDFLFSFEKQNQEEKKVNQTKIPRTRTKIINLLAGKEEMDQYFLLNQLKEVEQRELTLKTILKNIQNLPIGNFFKLSIRLDKSIS